MKKKNLIFILCIFILGCRSVSITSPPDKTANLSNPVKVKILYNKNANPSTFKASYTDSAGVNPPTDITSSFTLNADSLSGEGILPALAPGWYKVEVYMDMQKAFSLLNATTRFSVLGIPPPPQPDYIIKWPNSVASVRTGATFNLTANVESINGYSGNVSLSLSGAPQGITLATKSIAISSGQNSPVQITFSTNPSMLKFKTYSLSIVPDNKTQKAGTINVCLTRTDGDFNVLSFVSTPSVTCKDVTAIFSNGILSLNSAAFHTGGMSNVMAYAFSRNCGICVPAFLNGNTTALAVYNTGFNFSPGNPALGQLMINEPNITWKKVYTSPDEDITAVAALAPASGQGAYVMVFLDNFNGAELGKLFFYPGSEDSIKISLSGKTLKLSYMNNNGQNQTQELALSACP